MASFRKRGDTWQYRIMVPTLDGNFKEVSKGGFKTKKEAQVAANMRELEIAQGSSSDGGSRYFAQFFEEWYQLYKEASIAPKTQKNYLLSIKVAYEYFSKTKIKDLSEELYQDFINEYGSTRSKETVDKVHIHFKQALKRAVKKGYIRYNPAEDAIIRGTVKPKIERVKYLNADEQSKLVNTILENIRHNPQYVITDYAILVSLTCGLRFGELLGIGTDSFKDDYRKLIINRTWDYQITFQFAPTKNEASNRTIIVDDLTRKIIKQLIKYQRIQNINHRDKLLFINEFGQPISNTSINKRLRKYSAELGITQITHHSLRHSHISLLLYNQVNIKYVSRRAGHADIYTTLNTYSHIIDELEQSENEHISKIYTDIFA